MLRTADRAPMLDVGAQSIGATEAAPYAGRPLYPAKDPVSHRLEDAPSVHPPHEHDQAHGRKDQHNRGA